MQNYHTVGAERSGTIARYPAGLSMYPVPAVERVSDLIHQMLVQ
jgi:hypothetical protein